MKPLKLDGIVFEMPNEFSSAWVWTAKCMLLSNEDKNNYKVNWTYTGTLHIAQLSTCWSQRSHKNRIKVRLEIVGSNKNWRCVWLEHFMFWVILGWGGYSSFYVIGMRGLMTAIQSFHMQRNVKSFMQNEVSVLGFQHAAFKNKLVTMISRPCHCPWLLKEKNTSFF